MIKLTIDQKFKQAVILHTEGKIEAAERLYRIILKTQPEYLDANNNLGIILVFKNKLDEAQKIFKKVIELKPDCVEAHNGLGLTLDKLGMLFEAEASFKKVIELKPDHIPSYFNLGNVSRKLNKLDDAEASFKKVVELKPDHIQSYFNLGNVSRKLNKFDDAEASFKKVIELKPDHAIALNNLGNILSYKGDLLASIRSFKQALNIRPDLNLAWHSIYRPLQMIKPQTKSINDYLLLLDEKVTSKYAQISKSILSYRLNLGNPSTDKSFKDVLNILSSADNTFIKNPKLPSSELVKPTLPEKITALIHFGRSGTGLMHSLIDGHPEVSTLPSIYFSEFFDHFIWEKIIIGGWEEMADRFVKTYEVLFDASSSVPIATKNMQFNNNIGQEDGMTNVGPERNEVLSVDKKIFIKELKQLMNCYEQLDQFTFFKLVHSAYDKALNDHNRKNLIFYHIHHPDTYAQLNYLRLAPDTSWVIMVREPLQSCESWIKNDFNDDNHSLISNKIFQILFEVDYTIYQNQNSIGVKLEDLKKHPKKTIPALCKWLGIKEEDSLYEMTAQGKRWWGDPNSPDYVKDGMNSFGKTSINRKLGSVFSKNDQYILSTLFYPFNVRFGYVEENLEKFKNDLQTIRPMLDQMFDFEKKIVQNKKINTEKFMKSGPYLFLRSGMIERWNTLNKFHTYPNMLTLLKIN